MDYYYKVKYTIQKRDSSTQLLLLSASSFCNGATVSIIKINPGDERVLTFEREISGDFFLKFCNQ